DADHEADAGVGGFEDRVRRAGRRHVDDRRVRTRRLHGLRHGVEERHAFEVGATLAGCHAGDHLRAVFLAEPRVELPRGAEPLRENARLLVDEHRHRSSPAYAARVAAATAFSAPSRMSFAEMMSSFESARMRFPCSTFVPSMRTTSGTARPTSRAAAT